MANIDLNIQPAGALFPFAIIPGDAFNLSALPRARVQFRVNKTVITAKIATNTTSIRIECILPASYAYTFEFAAIDVAFPTDTDDAANYDDVGTVHVREGSGIGPRTTQLFSRGVSGETLNAGSAKIWQEVAIYPALLYNLLNVAPQLDLEVNDRDAGATVAGVVSSFVSFLQFDIEQIFNVNVNFPTPVAVR